MKKILSRIALIITSLLIAISINSYAAAEIFHIRGYDEEIVDYTVSNVIDTFDASTIDPAFDAGLVAELPVEVVLKNDAGTSFAGYRLEKLENNLYGYNPDDELEVSGKVLTRIPKDDAIKNQFEQYAPEDLKEVTLDVGKLEDYEYYGLQYLPGATILIDEPGEYYIMFRVKGTMGATEAIVRVLDSKMDDDNDVIDLEVEDEIVGALPSNATITIDEAVMAFEAYNINGNNFFKLRDLAYSLDGSPKGFEVTWDEESRVIEILKRKSYSLVGGEMSEGDGNVKPGLLNKSPILVDGIKTNILAYNINGNNYFKLRDVAKELDFGVRWEPDTKTIRIETKDNY